MTKWSKEPWFGCYHEENLCKCGLIWAEDAPIIRITIGKYGDHSAYLVHKDTGEIQDERDIGSLHLLWLFIKSLFKRKDSKFPYRAKQLLNEYGSISTKLATANAKRLSDCVNACINIPDPLNFMHNLKNLRESIITVIETTNNPEIIRLKENLNIFDSADGSQVGLIVFKKEKSEFDLGDQILKNLNC